MDDETTAAEARANAEPALGLDTLPGLDVLVKFWVWLMVLLMQC
jgi:hypothetical protein